MKEYAIYKGEKIIAMGTAREIAEELKVKINTVYWWNTRACKKRAKGNHKVAVKIS